jgi:citrate synthase
LADEAKLNIGGKDMSFPVVRGSEGEVAFDITGLLDQTGAITLDYGYANTGACVSAVTFLDGEKGILRYRGYPIEELAEHSSFLEVSYLLIYGELPNKAQFARFQDDIYRNTMLREAVRKIFEAFPFNAHPMAMLSSIVSWQSTYYQDSYDPHNQQHTELCMRMLLAKMPTIAAYSYKASIGQPLVYPNAKLGYCENFLQMMFSGPHTDYELDPEVVRALDQILLLHADHEQNCSTSTVRMVGSSRANIFASISAGINALWGPLHGGANQAVLEMLQRIHMDGGNVAKYVEMAKDKNSNFRLMGFGHRVYRNFDPRGKIIKRACDKVLDALGIHDPLLDIAVKLEEAAVKDDYFKERKLYPNVDFYSGIILRAIGFPTQMFPALFAIGRLPGWMAQWKEMMEDDTTRIGRPRQIYKGQNERHYTQIGKR